MEQNKALEILKSGKNVFLTGSAGTGKTYILNQYIDWLRSHSIKVGITASTGIAATRLNGNTIHSWSGMGIKDSITNRDLANLKEKKYLMKHISKTNVLIIDEISMLHKKQFQILDTILQYLKSNNSPFGGMQMVLSGDFFQLPPVTRQEEPSRDKFVFMSPSWVNAKFEICYLTEQYRQEGEHDILNQILQNIRSKNINDQDLIHLNKTKNKTLAITPTKLYTHNKDVDAINRMELDKIKQPEMAFTALKKGNNKLMESFVKALIVKEYLLLKKGAKVMFLKNNQELGYSNGSLGVVEGFYKDHERGVQVPIVKLTHGKTIFVKSESWSILNENGTPIVSFTQLPLKLAWAITVHKSQGMTLESAEIDLSQTFESGQGYVALSRLKSIEGLQLLGYNNEAFKVDDLAFKADKRFQELSKEAEGLDSEKLFADKKKHILNSGGKLLKLKKTTQKVSTYEITKIYLEKGEILASIAKKRGLSLATIQGHFMKISQDFPEVDISNYENKKVSASVLKAYIQIEKSNAEKEYGKDGILFSKFIYEKLNQKIGYGEIKLALAFLLKRKEIVPKA